MTFENQDLCALYILLNRFYPMPGFKKAELAEGWKLKVKVNKWFIV
jgi:hypothetical protein